MTLPEAVKTKKPYRRPVWKENKYAGNWAIDLKEYRYATGEMKMGFFSKRGRVIRNLTKEDILADDYITLDINRYPKKIVIKEDGEEFICYDADKFVNLQESDCYAFGETAEKALQNFFITISSEAI